MSSVKGRPRGRIVKRESEPNALLQGRVQPDVRQKANRAADAAGVSLAAYLEALIDRDTVDENGCPLWLTPRVDQQEELPLKIA